MDEEISPITIGSRVGDYIITQKLGQGGMCTVYKAIDPSVARYVAVKVLLTELSTPEALSDFMEEARFIAKMRHTNIVPLYSAGLMDGVPWLAMGYIEGQDMDQWVEEKGKLNLEDAKSFLVQATLALQHAAKSNVIHLDIKPSNFIRDAQGIILLADFGVARRISDGEKGLFEGQPVQGTPAFCSPEHILRTNLDIRTDIYSLGATLFMLMTGRLPYCDEDMMKVIRMHMNSPFPEDVLVEHEIPDGWRKFIKKMMEKDPADRFQNYEELLTALDSVKTFVHGKVLLENSFEGLRHTLPRSGGEPTDLFSMLPVDIVRKGEDLFRLGIPYNADDVLENLDNRWEILHLNRLSDWLRKLQIHDEHDVDDTVWTLKKIPDYRLTLDALATFMASDVEGAVINKEDEKLKFIGLDRTRNLAITTRALLEDWQPTRPLNHHNFWQHSIYTGLMASFMSDSLHLDTVHLEYACGLLYNIGRLVFLELYPNKTVALWMKAYQDCVPLEDLEREYFGLSHYEIGAEWLARNKFNKAICAVVRGSGDGHSFFNWVTSSISRPQFETLSQVTGCANSLVKEFGFGYVGGPHLPETEWLEQENTVNLLEYTEHEEAIISREQFITFFTETSMDAPNLSLINLCSSARAILERTANEGKRTAELRAKTKQVQMF